MASPGSAGFCVSRAVPSNWASLVGLQRRVLRVLGGKTPTAEEAVQEARFVTLRTGFGMTRRKTRRAEMLLLGTYSKRFQA
jgi:hypothetical protein